MLKQKKEEGKEVKKSRLSGFSYGLIAFISAVGLLLCINQIFSVKMFGFMPIGTSYYYYILTCYLSIVFLIFPGTKKTASYIPWYDWVIFVVCTVTTVFFGIHGYNILISGWEYSAPFWPTFASFVLYLLTLEGARRTGGFPIFIIAFIFSLYPLFADHMPGLLWGIAFSPLEIATYYAMGVDSIIGIPIRVVGQILIGFIVFGVALVSSGGAKFFMDFAMSLMGSKRGGAAKVSVISSALMASLSGSVISNVVTTGSITIPAMKKTGYSPKWAAAIEACSSTGGVITPPIMGAAGFLIASFLNVPYTKVMLAAIFPAVLYYVTLFIQIDTQAALANIGGLPKNELPKFLVTLKKGWWYIVSLILLIYALMYLRVEAWAPFYSILFLFVCSMFWKETRYDFKKFLSFFVEVGRLVGQITAILAGVGIIMGSLSGTGLANSFSGTIVALAGDSLFLLLILGAIVSFVLGMGMTVTACYVFLAIVLVPALVEFGLNEMACNLFVLYWGCLSYITPPVALGAITASAIAGSDNMATGFLSMRLAIPSYIVPFLFVLSPTMILIGPVGEVLLSVITGLIGCFFLANGITGYIYFIGKIKLIHRLSATSTGLFFLYPHYVADICGLVLVIITVGLLKLVPPERKVKLGIHYQR